MIPEGKYRAKATGAEFGVSDNSKDYCFVGFEILSGEHALETIGAWLYFSTEANTQRSIESLRYTGCTFPGGDITNLEGLGSRECEIVIEHESFEETLRARVKWINSGGAQIKEEQRMSQGQRSAFRDRMKGLVLATGAKLGNGSKPSNGAPPEKSRRQFQKESNERWSVANDPPPIDDSDIPF